MSLVVSFSESTLKMTNMGIKQQSKGGNENEGQQQQPSISFSICNILSDNFGNSSSAGKCKIKKEKGKEQHLFRPYEIQNSTNNYSKISSKEDDLIKLATNLKMRNLILSNLELSSNRIEYEQFNHFRLNDVFDLSPNNSKNKCKIENNNKKFEISSINYPKIHEEVYNNNKKYKKTINSLNESSMNQRVKIPQLGGLCKTISSQIGHQTSNLSFSPSIINESSSSSSSKTVLNNHQQQLPQQQQITRDSGVESSSDDTRSESGSTKDDGQGQWPAWVYCTRYSDRPSSGPRYRRPKKPKDKMTVDEKRPRTAFSSEQLARLKHEFTENRYLNERRRQQLSDELGLNEAQIKIWFQNKRAKIKKTSGEKNPLAMQLMAQGLYNHTTVPLTKEEEELEMRMNGQLV